MVVQSHPLLQSYNAALLDRIVTGLGRSGIEPEVFRLGEAERPGAGDLGRAEWLILLHPTWQAGLPAMLLDWLHEMLRSDREPFSGVTRLTGVTTGGSTRRRNRLIGDWSRGYLRTSIEPRCAPGTRLEWVALYKIDRRTQDEIDGFLERVETRFAAG